MGYENAIFANSSFQMTYRQIRHSKRDNLVAEKATIHRGFFQVCIQYSGWVGTAAPRGCWRLARALVGLGVDSLIGCSGVGWGFCEGRVEDKQRQRLGVIG